MNTSERMKNAGKITKRAFGYLSGIIRNKEKLLKKNFTEEERKEFKERNLNDTKYITRVVYNMIRQNLELEPFNHPKEKAGVGSQWSSDILPQKTLGTDTERPFD